MKAAVLLPIIVAAAALLAWRGLPSQGAPAASIAKAEPAPEPPPTVLSNATDIFQKAFWRRPAEDDSILHAERHEWAEGSGVRKWRWFMVVQPSPALTKRLLEENAFNLVRAACAKTVEGSPSWFSCPSDADAVVLQSSGSQSGMQLVISKAGGLLYATDSGGGFHPGAPEPPKPPPVSLAFSRRPLKLPPGR